MIIVLFIKCIILVVYFPNAVENNSFLNEERGDFSGCYYFVGNSK